MLAKEPAGKVGRIVALVRHTAADLQRNVVVSYNERARRLFVVDTESERLCCHICLEPVGEDMVEDELNEPVDGCYRSDLCCACAARIFGARCCHEDPQERHAD